ncbi:MAG: hypothetical protein AAFO99_11370, partial [Bacteroidota bacterium]
IPQNPQDTAPNAAFLENYHLKQKHPTTTVFQTIVSGFCYISLKITTLPLGRTVALHLNTPKKH